MTRPLPHPDPLLRLLHERGGLLTARAAAQAGLPSMTLSRAVERGVIERVQRGVYRLVDDRALPEVDLEAQELLELQQRFPFARPCLVSALHLHGLTTTRPAALQLAIPAHRHRPPISAPRTEVYFFRPVAYGTGLFSLDVRGLPLITYTPEKTLADLLRYAGRFGRDIYLEGIKKYLRSPERDLTLLTDTARRLKVDTALHRDLEVLLHDQDH
ncbi:type IV toxin-antitoxin system AbiEi family antitoxin domain-containing protein [Deinococcus sp.]|uniref:type IV toxin-antitoxin system AbiEi family antitoxin domain-containing protein n=1 Tax=Deinococcus sp. TaxID=47478 RepID=UPI003B5CE36B